MSWLNWRPKHIGFSWSWALNFPDASHDKCLKTGCGVERRIHDDSVLGHQFVEEGTP